MTFALFATCPYDGHDIFGGVINSPKHLSRLDCEQLYDEFTARRVPEKPGIDGDESTILKEFVDWLCEEKDCSCPDCKPIWMRARITGQGS